MITVGAQVAGGTALSATSLVMPYTAAVPQSSPTDGVQLFIAWAYWSTNPGGGDISDTATGGVGYSGFLNGTVGSSMGLSTAGGFNGFNWWGSGINGFTVLNPITTSDVLTWDFGGVTVDYLRASVFPVHNALSGSCVPGADFDTGGSAAWFGNGGNLPIGGTSGDTELAAGVAAFAPGVTSIDFIDAGITVLDSWLNDGPNSDISFICGYQTGLAPGTYDAGVTIAGPPLDPGRGGPIGPGQGGMGGDFWFSPADGVAFCPPSGSPYFNDVMFRAA